LAGLLTRSVFEAFPFAVANSGIGIQKLFLRAHSSGNCPGFTPDSLFTPQIYEIIGEPLRGKSKKSLK